MNRNSPVILNDTACIADENIYDVQKIRQDFPILHQLVHGKPLIYFDNAATTQKPHAVINAIQDFYTHDYANIHRGIHTLSERATAAYESVRLKVQQFINAKESREIIFVRGTTEAINLVAQSYGRSHLQAGDQIIISELEHHSNIVPWQMLCQQIGAELRVIPINDAGELILEEYERLITPHTKIVAVSHISNALGTINPIKKIIQIAHQKQIPVLIDGAQAAAHTTIDVQDLDCDFYTCSGHKMYGPSGIGFLYGKAELLEAMPPYQGGGDMISMVSFKKITYNSLPYKFEAGTPNIADVVGLGAAIDYVQKLGLAKIAAYETALLDYATAIAKHIAGLRIIGTAKHKASILSFVLEGIHPHDIGTILDRQGIAIRSGHHCAMPIMEHFGLAATARASFALYNTQQEIDCFMHELETVKKIFKG